MLQLSSLMCLLINKQDISWLIAVDFCLSLACGETHTHTPQTLSHLWGENTLLTNNLTKWEERRRRIHDSSERGGGGATYISWLERVKGEQPLVLSPQNL
jgi:hypothetical protein